MKLLALARTALLAFGFSICMAPAQAQQPLVGGTLYVAMPGTVSVRLIEDRTSSSFSWVTMTTYVTGSGSSDFGAFPDRIGKTTPHDYPDLFTNNAPGATQTSPVRLAAGDVIVTPIHIRSDFQVPTSDFPPFGSYKESTLVTTGGYPPYLASHFENRPAVVFAGQNNTAFVGFTASRSDPLSSNFLDYAIRIVVSNVCVK